MSVSPQTDPAAATAHSGFADLGFAKVDIERHARQGFSEVILGQGKSPGADRAIAREIQAPDEP